MKKGLLTYPLAFGAGVLFALAVLNQYVVSRDGLQHLPVAMLPDGSVYSGAIENGLLEGRGRLVWANGEEYRGGFSRGLSAGTGESRGADGSVHSGEYRQGLAHGEGRLVLADGSVYTGDFHRGHMTGRGVWEGPDNLKYTGEFEHGLFHGRGELVYAGGGHYEGQFTRGYLDGQGTYTEPGTGTYEGRFVKGDFTGQGKFTDQQGGVMEGAFLEWVAYGEGVRRDGDGNEWRGHFDGGFLSGRGEFKGADGSRYRGEFQADSFHGQGELVEADGNRYVGEFVFGSKHGEGMYEEVVDGAVVKVIEGRWQSDELAEGDGGGLSRYEKFERLVHNQSRLLNQQFDRLDQQDPGRAELYFLGIAGWGDQGVFEREVKYVGDKFNRLFGTLDKSVLLINGKDYGSEYPLATRHSIKLSLDALGAKMDAEKDVLFIFMTSHGEEDMGLAVRQGSLPLADLSVGEMARMLAQFPVKHKVVVVSACYSGQFVDALADEHTMVITAASADRTSFGCNDRNDFTYFGRAYFKEALNASGRFVEAFNAAVELVEAREKEEDLAHSKPRIHKPAALLRHLEEWRQGLKPPS